MTKIITLQNAKLPLILFWFLATYSYSSGQTTKDQETIIQMSIDLEELQPYYIQDNDKPLFILNNGTVPANLELYKFGKPVQFSNKEDLFFHGIGAFLDFQRFSISGHNAEVVFFYRIKKVKIEIFFEKIDGTWTIKSHKVVVND